MCPQECYIVKLRVADSHVGSGDTRLLQLNPQEMRLRVVLRVRREKTSHAEPDFHFERLVDFMKQFEDFTFTAGASEIPPLAALQCLEHVNIRIKNSARFVAYLTSRRQRGILLRL